MSLRILLIESDAAMLDTLQRSLGGRGYELNMVPDGLIGLAELERRPELPDLILLRVEIPRMSGYTVCNKIKRREKIRGIPLILFSSQATPETFAQHRRLRTRADGYLTVPFDEGELLSLLDTLTHGKALSGSFFEVPAVSPDQQQYSSIQTPARGPGQIGTMPDVQAVSMSDIDGDSFALDELTPIEDGDPMILSVEDLTEDHTPIRNAMMRGGGRATAINPSPARRPTPSGRPSPGPGGQAAHRAGDPLGAESLEALILEEQEMTAQQLRDLWSASLEEMEDDDMEATIVGQKPPDYSSAPHEVTSRVQDLDNDTIDRRPNGSGSARPKASSGPAWSTATPPSSGPFEPKKPVRDVHQKETRQVRSPKHKGSKADLENAVEQMIFERRLTSPDERDERNDRELKLDEAIEKQSKDMPTEERLVEERLVEEAPTENSRPQTDEEDDAGIEDLLDEHFQNLMGDEASESGLSGQERKQYERQIEALRAQIEALEQVNEGQATGNVDNRLPLELAEAHAQIEANQEEKRDLYEQITQLRRTIAEHKEEIRERDASASLSNVDSRREIDALEDQIGALERNLRKAEEHNERLEAKVDELQQELDSTRVQGDSSHIQLNEIQREYEALQRLYNERESQIDQNELVVDELRAQIKERDDSARELRSELAALRAHMQGQMLSDDELLDQMAEKEKQLQILHEDINQLGDAFDRLEKEYQLVLEERDRYHTELEDRNKALLSLSSGQDELRTIQNRMADESRRKSEEIDELKQRLSETDNEVEALHQEISTISEERNKYRDETLDLNNDVDAAKAEIRNLQDGEHLLRDRITELERERDLLQNELDSSHSKLSNLGTGMEDLELELVELRKINARLEQELLEKEEVAERAVQDKLELEHRFKAERDGREEITDLHRKLSESHDALREEFEKATEQRDMFYEEMESLRAYLQEETGKRSDLESAQSSTLRSLESVQQDLSSRIEQHQIELANLQEELQREAEDRIQQLHRDAAMREGRLLEEARQNAEFEKEQLQAELDAQREEELNRLHSQYQDEIHNLSMDHQSQLAQLMADHGQESNTLQNSHRDELEQLQRDLQEQHDQILSQMEAEKRKLRKQIRQREEDHRTELQNLKDELRKELERRVSDAEMQSSIRNQALMEGFAAQESKLEEQIEELQRQIREHELQNTQLMQEMNVTKLHNEEREADTARLEERIQDLEDLRQHEKAQFARLQEAHDEQIFQLEEKIQQLEKSLQKGITETSRLYQQVKRHEMRKETTASALRDALALLNGDDDEPMDVPDSRSSRTERTPLPERESRPSSRSSRLERRTSDSRPSSLTDSRSSSLTSDSRPPLSDSRPPLSDSRSASDRSNRYTDMPAPRTPEPRSRRTPSAEYRAVGRAHLPERLAERLRGNSEERTNMRGPESRNPDSRLAERNDDPNSTDAKGKDKPKFGDLESFARKLDF